MRSFRYRIYPNKEQQQKLAQHFGNARWMYNWGLSKRKELYENGEKCSYIGLTYYIKDLRKDFDWLRKSQSNSLAISLDDLGKSFDMFFRNKSSYPKYKSKWSKSSVTYRDNVYVKGSFVRIPKIGNIKCVVSRECFGNVKRATITKTTTGKYYVSVLTDYEVGKPTTSGSVGIDVGIKEFAVLSDGSKIENPKFLRKSLVKLAKEQRILSRKKKGSNNRNKQRLKVARVHEKVKHQRQDFLHKQSTMIANKYHTIAIEDLNITAMVKNRKLSQSISDAGRGMFYIMLHYKANEVLKVDRFAPSTKTCSNCGSVKSMKLSDRIYDCDSCGYKEDRDVNAAKNILSMSTVRNTGINDSGE